MSAERRAVAPEAPAAAAEASCAAGIAPAPETACEAGTAPAAEAPAADPSRRAAVFFVGNRLMMDDGVAPAAFDLMLDTFEIPANVQLLDVGCMALDMLGYVEACDVILTVDAVDGTGDAPGTVYRFEPDAMARHAGPEASLHDLKLVDLFDAASLMGYAAEGYCLGMQVENPSPSEFYVGLTPACEAALPLLVETVAAELDRRGFPLTRKG
ncbi:hydrogenase maturation protease [Adlercreutzia caecimuris]|uniref:Hydrogenase maturation protease n=1 Tax=Adlercreutzia caecimuris B7 TaxID=1235794 RepID=R9KYV2_9ACTN|nr:hydrogenase maturation protease [Adlercreutzia caecimuris]EOS51366.1 hydrogenase maturation protease [Adlercreutzia caecimuris B7]